MMSDMRSIIHHSSSIKKLLGLHSAIMRYTCLLATLCIYFNVSLFAQEQKGTLSGNFQANANFFIRDTAIGAANTPQYDRQLYGADAWLNLNYNYSGFDVGVRFDLFNNSNLLNPQSSYTAEGIGRWYIKKKVDKFSLAGGYLYDQIGSGIIFRAYEERPLLIDNALFGVRVAYDLNEDWQIKALTGRQKQQFDTYSPVIKAFNIDGFVAGPENRWSISPGFGLVNRTYDDETMQRVVSTVSTFSVTDSIAPSFNTYAFTFYNTLSVGNINWYVEAAWKTEDVLFDPFATKTNRDGSTVLGKLINETGSVYYTSLAFAGKGFGLTLEGKRTENFSFRTTPFVSLNRGMINFLPPMSRFNTYRLTSRYTPAIQELGEQAVKLELRFRPQKNVNVEVNLSNITDLDNQLLYREAYTEIQLKKKRKWVLTGGFQFQQYNQEIFETKPGVPIVQTLIPFVDFLYKIDRKKSIRFELQYMRTEQDFGSWIFGLVEYSIAPKWTFTISDMYNSAPTMTDKIHYPRIDLFYTIKSNRFSVSYVKQVEGVVCSGGICRLEPAFSGFRFTAVSAF
ncbi:MAG: DUF6029 family protein [Bacteroidota bacterium]